MPSKFFINPSNKFHMPLMTHQYSLPSLSLLYFLFLASILNANAGNITTYWGQNADEGSLVDACSTGNYGIINIAFLNVFGNNRTPSLNLTGHCDPNTEDCTWLSDQIKSCQSQGVKVFLSIGGGFGNYSLASADDAGVVAKYLWQKFLGGGIPPRPLGRAVLDGIDFAIEGGTTLYWDELVRRVAYYRSEQDTIYLSASPQCPYPDPWMGTAIDIVQFNYVWVQFYNNPSCQYTTNANNLISNWNNHWTKIKAEKLFLGVPAAPDAVDSGGYISPDVLISEVLPSVKNSSKYGGVMLWSRYWDTTTGYSDAIKSSV